MASNVILLPIKEAVSSAWEKVDGAKGTIWAALGVTILIAIGFVILEEVGKLIHPNLEPVISFIAQLIGFLLQMGLLYIGIKRALDSPIRYTMVFNMLNLNMAVKLIVLYILEILILLPVAFIFLFLPSVIATTLFATPQSAKLFTALFYLIGIVGCFYLIIRMVLALAFVLDRNDSPWNAIKQSFRATQDNFWRIVIIGLVKICAVLLGVITLGIGLIWMLPFVTILYGVVYKKLKGNAA